MIGNSAMKELIGKAYVKYEIDFLLCSVIPDICIHGDCNFYVLYLNDAVQKTEIK